MRCHRCGKEPRLGTALYRQNKKGEPGVWACRGCNRAPVDPAVERVVKAIEGGQK